TGTTFSRSAPAGRRGLRRPRRPSPYSRISPQSRDQARARRETLERIGGSYRKADEVSSVRPRRSTRNNDLTPSSPVRVRRLILLRSRALTLVASPALTAGAAPEELLESTVADRGVGWTAPP